nr:transposase [Burkholderia ubonensis]
MGKPFAAEARSTKWEADRRQRLRRRYSARVLTVVEQTLMEHRPAVVPAGMLDKALQYLRGRWHKLVHYVENGDCPISRNPCENALGSFVVGRRYRCSRAPSTA